MRIKAAILHTLFVAVAAIAFVSPCAVYAEDLKIEVSNSEAIKSALQALVGKSATINTVQGEPISGVVEAVGPDAVKLSQLSGKEFYSAVIRLDAVSAVTFRVK